MCSRLIYRYGWELLPEARLLHRNRGWRQDRLRSLDQKQSYLNQTRPTRYVRHLHIPSLHFLLGGFLCLSASFTHRLLLLAYKLYARDHGVNMSWTNRAQPEHPETRNAVQSHDTLGGVLSEVKKSRLDTFTSV